jgi:hypothetical protein
LKDVHEQNLDIKGKTNHKEASALF